MCNIQELEKEIGVIRVRSAAHQHRAHNLIIVAELVSEAQQVINQQQLLIAKLHAELKKHEKVAETVYEKFTEMDPTALATNQPV